MKCPKCASPMLKVKFGEVELDRCTSCQGLWFDEFAREILEKLKGSQPVDTGDAAVGRQFNKVDRILCPKCETPMLRMVHLHQHHIWFEHCKVCGGSFFDAGEFRDLKSHSILDLFRDWLTPERR